MLIVLSPAKSLDFEKKAPVVTMTEPVLLDQAGMLIDRMREVSALELQQLMAISPALAELNVQRFRDWQAQPDRERIKQAAFAFNGDVYDGLSASTLPLKSMDYLQSHVRILSGLYGVLRPFDALQPYRLEMGTALQNLRGRNLYAFWGDRVSQQINLQLSQLKLKTVLNLASEEYFKVIKNKALQAEVLTPVFQDWKSGQYKVISFFAKRARGLMARYCIEHGIQDAIALRGFDLDGYRFIEEESTPSRLLFRRKRDE
ncbi:peroxide stress protein YaaA [Undibacterium crateris]|uniref:peroxide stress protein YaaA n=1 Tax=Undibacterium crateris TaxID=2528175 RepID=UPI0013899288|nr:peroxide stress protein YaaA [Undibacterium crateris]NDI86585.1 peroxide stress protein YaaA [Undibacterium crateris]